MGEGGNGVDTNVPQGDVHHNDDGAPRGDAFHDIACRGDHSGGDDRDCNEVDDDDASNRQSPTSRPGNSPYGGGDDDGHGDDTGRGGRDGGGDAPQRAYAECRATNPQNQTYR